MEEQFSRTEGLLGEEAVAHLHGCHVAVFGVGVLEVLWQRR